MGAHTYIEAEDLGLTVLGTVQNAYAVNGVHGQNYGEAVSKAALCRTAALEETMQSFSTLLRTRQRKLDDLGNALAALNEAFAQKGDKGTSDNLPVDRSAVTLLKRYGFTASTQMTFPEIMKLQQNVQFALDQEDNELQQDMTSLQSYVSKRDDAMEMANKLLTKVNSTRQKGIQYIGS